MNDPKENLEIFKSFGINGYENIRSLAEINLRTWEKLVEKQMDTFGLLIDAGIEQITADKAKDPKALIDSQIALGKSLSENLASKGREAVDLATQAGGEYRSWLENGINTFNSKVAAAVNESEKK